MLPAARSVIQRRLTIFDAAVTVLGRPAGDEWTATSRNC
jgi:hypothetical protein